MKYVCVLDMDETLGFYEGNKFHVRPKLQTLINFLQLIEADIILWSLGSDSYVTKVVNGFLPELAQSAFKIFARSECQYAQHFYTYRKASAHIRDMYSTPVFLMAVDDKVSENMDEQYDLRIFIPPYSKINSADKELLVVVEKMINGIVALKNQDV